MYTGPIKYIDRGRGDRTTPGFKGGYVIDTEGRKHLAGKVQSIPARTMPTPPRPAAAAEKEETRREAEARKLLREMGIVKAIEEYLERHPGGQRMRDIQEGAKIRGIALIEEPVVGKWKAIVGTTKGIIDVIRRFREKFEVYDEAKGGYAKLVGDDATTKGG